ncbi:MAG: trigger factor [Actinomycetota bacterium]|nr:trigger factor [Actinomycetota bacterium]
MKTEVTEKKGSQVVLKVVAENEDLESFLKDAYREFSLNLKIPGFRKGKIPREIIDRHIGRERVRLEALKNGLPELYMRGIMEAGILPVCKPELNIVEVGEDGPVVFEAKVDVKPEIELKDYKGVRVAMPDTSVTDEDVKKALDDAREKFATLEPVEGKAVENGDYVTFNYKVFADGVPLEGKSGSDIVIEIGANDFLPGFDEQLLKARKGDVLDVAITFPPDYEVRELAGKPATFRTMIKEVKKKVLPPLDDLLARELGDFNNLDELREDIKKRLEETKKSVADKVLRDRILKTIMDRTYVEIPEKMIEEEVAGEIEQFEERLEEKGITLDDYLKAAKLTRYELEKSIRKDVAEEIKSQLILDAVANAEGIEASEEEAKKYLERIAETSGVEPKEFVLRVEEQGGLPSMMGNLRLSNAMDFLVENACVAGEMVSDGIGEKSEEEEKSEDKEKQSL